MPSLASRKVLVLNRGWNPIAVVSCERAICLLTGTIGNSNEPKARIIDPANDFSTWTWDDWSELRPKDDEDRIRGCRQDYRIPEVILLSRYNKLPQQRVHFSRRTIYRRDGQRCQYCLKKKALFDLSIDHIVPRKHGGETTWTNCIIACVACNSAKADLHPKPIMENGKVVAFEVYFNDHKRPKVVVKQPVKPEFTLFKGECHCKSWHHFISESYWQCELVNDNKE